MKRLIKKVKTIFKKEPKPIVVSTPIKIAYKEEHNWDDLTGKLTVKLIQEEHIPTVDNTPKIEERRYYREDMTNAFSETLKQSDEKLLKTFNEKLNKPSLIPKSMKEAAQDIGLDLVEIKRSEPIEITSGYYHFEPDEIVYANTDSLKETNPKLYYKNLYENAEKTLFQMKKVHRASEKVLEKILEHDIEEEKEMVMVMTGTRHFKH